MMQRAEMKLLSPILKLAERLRFPYLFAVTAILFIVDLLVPDVIPLVDELLLGLLTILFGALRKKRRGSAEQDPPRIAGERSPTNEDAAG